MSPSELIFKAALCEKLEAFRKTAFVPMDPQSQQQATGPGGMPVPDPAAGGAAGAGAPPMGGAPMDPMAAMGGAGAPPPGGAPMDPMAAAGGAPPADPMAAMGGAMPPAPTDPAAGGAMPPMPDMAAGAAPSTDGVTPQDVDTIDKITQRTLDTVHQALAMVGKAKTKEQLDNDAQLQMQDAANKAQQAATQAPATVPGPVTGAPMSADALQIPGTPKLASILSRGMKQAAMVTDEEPGALQQALLSGFPAAVGGVATPKESQQMLDVLRKAKIPMMINHTLHRAELGMPGKQVNARILHPGQPDLVVTPPSQPTPAAGTPKTAATSAILKRAFQITPEMVGAGTGAAGAALLAAVLSKKKNKLRNALLAAGGGALLGSAAGAGYRAYGHAAGIDEDVNSNKAFLHTNERPGVDSNKQIEKLEAYRRQAKQRILPDALRNTVTLGLMQPQGADMRNATGDEFQSAVNEYERTRKHE